MERKLPGKNFPNLGIPREVVIFWEILENVVPFATGSCRKLKPDVLVEWKAPRTSFSDVPLLPGSEQKNRAPFTFRLDFPGTFCKW